MLIGKTEYTLFWLLQREVATLIYWAMALLRGGSAHTQQWPFMLPWSRHWAQKRTCGPSGLCEQMDVGPGWWKPCHLYWLWWGSWVETLSSKGLQKGPGSARGKERALWITLREEPKARVQTLVSTGLPHMGNFSADEEGCRDNHLSTPQRDRECMSPLWLVTCHLWPMMIGSQEL